MVRSSSSDSASMTTTSSRSTMASSTTSLSRTLTADAIVPEQRPKFVQPGLPTLSWPGEKPASSIVYANRIYAPIAIVASSLIDTRSYGAWNRFCPSAHVNSQPRSTAPLPPIIARDPSVVAIANLPTTLRDGATFTMAVNMDATSSDKAASAALRAAKSSASGGIGSTPELKITALDQYERPDGRVCVRIAWRTHGKVTSFFLRNERVHELTVSPNDPGVTDYVCWESFYGGLHGPMQSMYGRQIERGYGIWMDGLKKNAEERARGRSMAEQVKETSSVHSRDVSVASR